MAALLHDKINYTNFDDLIACMSSSLLLFHVDSWDGKHFLSKTLQKTEKYRKKCIRVFLVIFWTLVIWTTFSTQLVTCFTRNKVNNGIMII